MKKVIVAASLLTLLSFSQVYAQQGGGNRADSSRAGMPRMRDMAQVETKDLPTAALDYVKKEFASAEIRRAAKDDKGQFYVMLVEGEKRQLLTFDAKGALVDKREMRGRPGGGGNNRR
jgi:hypothetical protein